MRAMEKQWEFGPPPPSYSEATAPPCIVEPYPHPQPYPSQHHGQLPYPPLHQPQPYPQPVRLPPYPQQQPSYPSPQQPAYSPQSQPPYPPQPQLQPSYPPQQPPYPQQPQPAPQSVVIGMPPYQAPVSFGVCSVRMVCPNCRNPIMTSVSRESREGDCCKLDNHLLCFFMFILGFILYFTTWICSCLPYICNTGRPTCTYRHSCPRCNALLGSFFQ